MRTRDWKKFESKYAGAIVTHNAVELLRERGPEVGFKARDLHQKRLQACADITLRWMEPFSLELWLKAVIQEQQGPNTPIESKEDDHPSHCDGWNHSAWSYG